MPRPIRWPQYGGLVTVTSMHSSGSRPISSRQLPCVTRLRGNGSSTDGQGYAAGRTAAGYLAGMRSRRVGAACVAVAVGTLAWTAAAGAVTVGTGTFAAPLGAVNWRWTVTLRRWTPTDIMVKQRLDLQTPFLGHPEVSLEQDVVPERGGRLSIQTRRTAVPVDDDV